MRVDSVAFDIIGTAFSLEPMRGRLIADGLPASARGPARRGRIGADGDDRGASVDRHGAKMAGLVTGLVARGRTFPDVMAPPVVQREGLRDVAGALTH